MKTPPRNMEFELSLDKLRRADYSQGYLDGLAVAKTIRGWLTRWPDRAWQKRARLDAGAEIKKAEDKLNKTI